MVTAMKGLRSIVPLSAESLRGIEPAELGNLPKIEWVDPRTLYVEDDYQRTMQSANSVKLVRKIVGGFSWARLKPPICVRIPEYGNALVLIDGQHSATAAASHPKVDKIPVVVVDGSAIADRAEAFVGHNRDRINLTQMAIFKAELAAGDATAAAVERACQASGARVVINSINLREKHPVGTTIAVGTLRMLLRTRGEAELTRVLTILVKAGRGPIKAEEIAAVGLAIDGADQSIDGRLVPVIAKHSTERWHSMAATMVADTDTAPPIALATLWREELGLSRPSRNLRGSGNSAKNVLRQARAPKEPKKEPEARLQVPGTCASSQGSSPPYVAPVSPSIGLLSPYKSSVPGILGRSGAPGVHHGSLVPQKTRLSSQAPRPAVPQPAEARAPERPRSPKAATPAPQRAAPVPQKPAPALPAPQPKPSAPAGAPAPIEHNGIRVDLATGTVRRRNHEIRLDRDQAMMVGILVRVSPSLLGADRIAPKIWGSHSPDQGTLLTALAEQANGGLARLGLKIRVVPKVGYVLADL